MLFINLMNISNIDYYSSQEILESTGKTYVEWATEWWKWLVGLESNHNPWCEGTQSVYSLIQQEQFNKSPNVFFFADSLEVGDPTISVKIRELMPIWVPLARSVYSNTEDKVKEIKTQFERDKQYTDEETISLYVDDNKLDIRPSRNSEEFRTWKDLGSIQYAKATPLNSEENPISYYTTLVGYFIMLKPLPPGHHTIHFVRDAPGSIDNPIDNPPLHRDISYNITVNK